MTPNRRRALHTLMAPYVPPDKLDEVVDLLILHWQTVLRCTLEHLLDHEDHP